MARNWLGTCLCLVWALSVTVALVLLRAARLEAIVGGPGVCGLVWGLVFGARTVTNVVAIAPIELSRFRELAGLLCGVVVAVLFVVLSRTHDSARAALIGGLTGVMILGAWWLMQAKDMGARQQ